MVSMPSPAAMTSPATPKRTALPSRSPIARLGVSIGALSRRPIGSSQVRCTPVILPSRSVTAAIIAGQVSVGESCVRPIVAARMEAQASDAVQSRDAAIAQIRFHDCARNRLRHGEEPACRFRRSGRRCSDERSPMSGSGSGSRQAEEAPGLVGDVAEVDKTAAFADDVEEIAMLAGRGVGPFAGCALAGIRSLSRTNMERPGVFLTSPTNQ